MRGQFSFDRYVFFLFFFLHFLRLVFGLEQSSFQATLPNVSWPKQTATLMVAQNGTPPPSLLRKDKRTNAAQAKSLYSLLPLPAPTCHTLQPKSKQSCSSKRNEIKAQQNAESAKWAKRHQQPASPSPLRSPSSAP